MQPRCGDRPFVNSAQGQTVELELALKVRDFSIQLGPAHHVGFEIHQPDFLRQNDCQIDIALHHEELVAQLRGVLDQIQMLEVFRGEARRKRNLAMQMGALGEELVAQLGAPEIRHGPKVKDRGFAIVLVLLEGSPLAYELRFAFACAVMADR